MISINSRGQVSHGTGGGYASVDNVAFHRGAAFGWIDDDTILFANGDDPFAGTPGGPMTDWPISAYDISSQQAYRLLGDVAANVGFASGRGVWASWWGTLLQNPDGTSRSGIYASTGFRDARGALLGVGPSGAIAYKLDYQSGGPTVVREISGAQWTLTPNHAYNLQLIQTQPLQRAVFVDSVTGLTFLNLGQPHMLEGGAWGVKAVFVGGEWWVAYYAESTACVVLHPFTEPIGYFVSPKKQDAWFNVRALSDNVVYCPWSSKEGEQPGEMTLGAGVTFNVKTEPRVPLFTDPIPIPPKPPEPPQVLMPKVTVITWDKLMKAGTPWQTTFTTGLQDTVVVQKTAQDRLIISCTNAAGKDQTGVVRQLTVEGPPAQKESS